MFTKLEIVKLNEPLNYNDYNLKNEIAAGNEAAFKILFERYHKRLFQYVFKLVKSNEIAEELVMDVFVKIWLARNTVPEIKNFDSFIFRVAYNKTIDFFRSAAKNERFVDLLYEQVEAAYYSPNDAHQILISKEYEQQLKSAIELLPERRKQMYELSRDGQSHEEIAQKLGVSKSTVANSIVSAKEFIIKNLKTTIDI
ncbi:MAG: sigma-70 family RNA polymerase sigma factor, partial [Bacteroidia bacterium]